MSTPQQETDSIEAIVEDELKALIKKYVPSYTGRAHLTVKLRDILTTLEAQKSTKAKLKLYKSLLEHGVEHGNSCLHEKVHEIISDIDATLTPKENA